MYVLVMFLTNNVGSWFWHIPNENSRVKRITAILIWLVILTKGSWLNQKCCACRIVETERKQDVSVWRDRVIMGNRSMIINSTVLDKKLHVIGDNKNDTQRSW